MTCPVETLSSNDGVYDATRRMMELQVRRLPVVNPHGDLIGLISLDDLLLLLARELGNITEGIQAEAAVA
jgi:signal-transduction protein with cAMP-binding, CBS, and nucleotidyltransferase domain